ncbi:MAG: hypothetical protein RMZ43_002420 [Nostoc sp. CmiVER01]|nr:hypothetical protein [Nostoc sp. CmiVER01]MDZ8126199.1 hypothetical protein [Nostoc sp. CmiVER01]
MLTEERQRAEGKKYKPKKVFEFFEPGKEDLMTIMGCCGVKTNGGDLVS